MQTPPCVLDVAKYGVIRNELLYAPGVFKSTSQRFVLIWLAVSSPYPYGLLVDVDEGSPSLARLSPWRSSARSKSVTTTYSSGLWLSLVRIRSFVPHRAD